MTTCVCGRVVRLDVTLITAGWRNLLATGMDSCGGHCHTQSQVRPEGCVCIVLPSSLVISGPGAWDVATLGGQFRKILETG